jgi:hypothetical protein
MRSGVYAAAKLRNASTPFASGPEHPETGPG